MLSAQNRLKKKKDFEKAFKNGLTMKNKYFFLRVLKGSEENNTRIGFIVSKKVSKKAVERNRVKRLFREAARMRIEKIKKGYDLVFIVLNSANNKTLVEIGKEIEIVLEKSKLINI